MKLYVVPEDHRRDRHVLKPLFEKLLNDSDVPGTPNVKIDQNTKGLDTVSDELDRIAVKYGHYDAILLAIDNDCEDREEQVEDWIEQVNPEETSAEWMTCIAIQELEIWLLALYDDQTQPYWEDLRDECDLKEAVFEGFLDEYGDSKAKSRGRERLTREGLKETSTSTLLQKCQELETFVEQVEALYD